MITTKPLCADDLMRLDVQQWQRVPEYEITPEYCAFLVDNSHSGVTVWADDKIICAGGAIEIWNGRAEVWTLIDKDAGPWMLGLTRVVERFVAMMPFHRLETCCEVNWPQAHRWLKMLGFEHERLARKYLPSGRDVDIYVRIK